MAVVADGYWAAFKGRAELGLEWVCPQRLELLKPADLERLLVAVRDVCLEHRRRELLEDGGAK